MGPLWMAENKWVTGVIIPSTPSFAVESTKAASRVGWNSTQIIHDVLLPWFLPLQNGLEKHWEGQIISEGFVGVCINLPHFLIFFAVFRAVFQAFHWVDSMVSKSTVGAWSCSMKPIRDTLFWSNYSDLTRPGTSKGSVLEGKSPYFREI